MNDINSALLIVCTTLAGLPALLVLVTILVPAYVERAKETMRSRPWRSLLLGLVNFVFFALLVLLTEARFALLALLGILSLTVALPLSLVAGLVVAAGCVGEELWLQAASRRASLLGSLLIGTLVLGPTLLVPVLGWIAFTGLVLAGLGAAITALFQRRQSGQQATAQAAAAEPRT